MMKCHYCGKMPPNPLELCKVVKMVPVAGGDQPVLAKGWRCPTICRPNDHAAPPITPRIGVGEIYYLEQLDLIVVTTAYRSVSMNCLVLRGNSTYSTGCEITVSDAHLKLALPLRPDDMRAMAEVRVHADQYRGDRILTASYLAQKIEATLKSYEGVVDNAQ